MGGSFEGPARGILPWSQATRVRHVSIEVRVAALCTSVRLSPLISQHCRCRLCSIRIFSAVIQCVVAGGQLRVHFYHGVSGYSLARDTFLFRFRLLIFRGKKLRVFVKSSTRE